MRFATLLASTAALLAAPAIAQTTGNSPVVPASPSARPGSQIDPTQNAPAATPTPAPSATSEAPAPAAAPTPAPTASPSGTPTPNTTIAAALPGIPDHGTLVRLVKAADLDGQLAGTGPFTLLAPNDAAFARLPAGTLDTLTAPSNKAGLQTIVRNHVIAGTLTEADLRQRITAGNGRTTLNTLSGQPITATLENNVVLFTDAVGNKSYLDKADLRQANGVIHSTNGLSLPKIG